MHVTRQDFGISSCKFVVKKQKYFFEVNKNYLSLNMSFKYSTMLNIE